ncbi:MAG: aminotransferase class I/II-fold pyridoxal phosphate-dependent enzyme, partial [Pseudolysinimonas sp.]
MTALANGSLRAAVIDTVSARTMYEPRYLQTDSHLEGELGIDSVVLQSILATLQQQFCLAAQLPTDVRTIGDLVDAVERATAAAVAPEVLPKAEAARLAPAASSLVEAVITATIHHTRYRRDQLDLDAELERDLGIDSVVIAAVTADVCHELGLSERSAAASRTLRELIDRLDPLEARPPARVRPAPAAISAPPTPSLSNPTHPAASDWDGRSMKDFIELPGPDLFAKTRAFADYYRKRQDDQLYWYGMPLQSQCRNRAVIRDEQTGRTREYLMFASNNYLGLANHPKVIEAICDATAVYGATHTGCRIIGGTNQLHKELEERLADFKKRPACIAFPSGYSANLGTISALARAGDTVISDKFNHMSIVDGTKLAGANRRIYQHNDMADLEGVLQRVESSGGGALIVADGVFSMHGDICDLPAIVKLARKYGARVLVDDAHSTGVLGATGSGTAEHFGLKGAVDLELGTMSKALGGMGGFVVGDTEVIEYLRFYANSYVFAATIPAGIAAGLIAAIQLIQAEPER